MTLEELLVNRKNAVTEYQKACIEQEIRKVIRNDPNIRIKNKEINFSLKNLIGEPEFSIENRQNIFNSKSELLWRKIDNENLSLTAAVKILRKAKLNKDLDISESIARGVHSYGKTGRLIKLKGKPHRLKIGVNSTKNQEKIELEIPKDWEILKKSVIEFMKSETQEIDDISNYEVVSNFIIDLELLIRDCKNKIHKSKNKSVVLRKSEVVEACSILGISNFKFGNNLNREEVKSKFKKLARDSHPDIHGPKLEWKFKEIVSAYRIVEDYMEVNFQM